MKKRKSYSRKIDLRKIRPTKTYTLQELATDTAKTINTVWRWRREGMPTIPDSNGQLVDGAEFVAWEKKRRAARKRPCKLDQFYCFGSGCCIQRHPAMGSVLIRKSNQKLGSIEALCAVCSAKVKKGFSMADLAEVEAALESFIGNIEDLALYRDSPV